MNVKNSAETHTPSTEPLPPAAWVERFLPLAPSGQVVLDVAAGSGRHSHLALKLGYPVLALDRAVGGLVDLVNLANQENTPNFELLETDLESNAGWPLGSRRFGAVIVSNYLYRPILRDIVRAVAPQGILIYTTFAMGNEALGRPRNPDFLLHDGELLEAVAGELSVIAYEQGRVETATRTPAIIQRICAIREPEAASYLRLADS